eukprot:TRINITY_DN42925_c0_g1_i1.p1 TRINITY_DN42925_c0_g1~~TRINITY_DN42925_c0_g1_i1.p1  ORF type:complete len:581 (-),score=134.57 TRINITY_DN42925_c0_g1_i1:196-1938(-)
MFFLSCCSAGVAANEEEIGGPNALSEDNVNNAVSNEPEVILPPAIPEETQKHQDTLNELLEQKPYLKKDEHALHYYVSKCTEAILAGDVEAASNAQDILTMNLDNEEKMIAAAFVRFDTDKSGILQGGEIQFMLDYLGFPDSQQDVDRLLSVVDKNKDDSVSLDEFLEYVGKLGGSQKLFEVRRRQIQDRGAFTSSTLDPECLRFLLQECGISPESQDYWRLVASESELDCAACLDECQKAAVRHIRALAQENHERALPDLQKRFTKLGYTDAHLWMCLAWIRELAPLIVHINLDKIGQFLVDDTHYRNQFETNTSGGLLKTSAREKWERSLFGTSYDNATAFQRPKYGVQSIWNDPRGVMGAKQYGDSYFVLKDVRLRCTLSPQDSANLPARRLSVLDFYAHVFAEYSDKEIIETIRVADKGAEKVGDSASVIESWGKYKECQIHGEIDLKKHVDRLVVNERHRKQADWIESICKNNGWTLTWMDDMKSHLESKASGHELSADEWKVRLSKLGRAATKVITSDDDSGKKKAAEGSDAPNDDAYGFVGQGKALKAYLALTKGKNLGKKLREKQSAADAAA